jgi:hypothetical protein
LYDTHLWEQYTGTFDPKIAITEDTSHFFAFGHPLFDAIIRYCTDDERNNHFDAQVALRVLHHPDYRGYTGMQFNYILTFEGVSTEKQIIPIVLRPNGTYDEELSHLIFSLPSDKDIAFDSDLSESELQELEGRSQEIIAGIANQEMEKVERRNLQDYEKKLEKVVRLFDFRLQDQKDELEERNQRLEDAEKKDQKQILPAIKGQVSATEKRIEDLRQQKENELAQLEKRRDVRLSIDQLNLAYVRII